MNMGSIVDFVTSGETSDLPELLSDDESKDERNIMDTMQRQEELKSSDNDEDEDEDVVPFSQLAANETTNNVTTPFQQPQNQPYNYCW